MEAVGVGLGTVALISTVLDVFRLVTSFRTYSEASTILFRQLEREREVLLRWATEVGLHQIGDAASESRTAIPTELLPLVHKIVATIGALLAKATATKETKGNFESDVQELRLVLEVLQSEIDGQKQSRQSRLSRSLTRLGWAIGEEERLKDLITTIHAYNTSLHNLIPKPLQIRLDGSLMQILLSEKDQDELLEIQQASLHWRKAISVVASVTALQQTRSITAPPSANQLMLQRSKFASLGPDMVRYLTRYESHDERVHVLVEWRAYKIPHNSEKKFQYLNTCLDLARLLHASQSLAAYRTMDCIGIFDDIEFRPHPRVGLVYRVPPIIGSHPRPSAEDYSIQICTLYDTINRKEFSRPRLDQRFDLARSLATGLHRLFVSRWYHKNLNSKNILFFTRKEASTERMEPPSTDGHILHPFLSGFDYARPDSPDEMTIKPEVDEFCDRYRHPQCTHPDSRETIRYSRRFDIYSLGVLLMEIGRWETVDKMQKEYMAQRKKRLEKAPVPAPPPSLQDFQRYLRTRCVESLGFRMGRIYMDVVKFCLDGGGNGTGDSEVMGPDAAVEELLVDRFNKEVVAELARCTV
ncbi:prion-inhibition and propagation-domain-containing protein [Xylariaceae sp. AK1471]|nr:prion-inhibition and propagation-domain-containing protein [Xylariaceae sp. AK1471]